MTSFITRRTLLALAGAASASAALAGAVRAEGGWSLLPPSTGEMFATNTPLHVRDVTLRVRDMALMTNFYVQVLGFAVLDSSATSTRLGVDGVTLLTLDHRPDAPFGAPTEAGLYHTAFLMPSRSDLAAWLVHAAMLQVQFSGFADHRVSEAIYLDDPEGNGIEVYADRASELWSWNGDTVVMGSEAIDFDSLLGLVRNDIDTYPAAPKGLRIGHIHLRAGAIEAARAFYNAALGLDITSGREDAVFLSSGRYHHHVALNTWQSAGAGMRDPDATGLAQFTLAVTEARLIEDMRARLAAAGHAIEQNEGDLIAADPWGTAIRVAVV